jgi:NADPH:quinone reductase-like Zn-dependent oxidoreductase
MSRRKMRANAWLLEKHGRPSDVLRWRSQELPAPGPGEALVKIRSVGLNRADLNYVLGSHFPARAFPSGLGGEAVGEILELGSPAAGGNPPAVRRLNRSVGTRVATLSGRVDRGRSGIYRDIALLDQAALLPVPDSYTDTEAAAFWTALFTMGGALEMAGYHAGNAGGKTLLFTAAGGGVGVLGLRLARHWGARTIATTRDEKKADDLAAIADDVIVCADGEQLAAGVSAATDGRGVDLALDPVGASFYPGLFEATARGGQIVSYECISGTRADLPIMTLMMKDLCIRGFTTFRVSTNPALLDTLVDLGMDHADALRPVVARTCSLAEAPGALESLERSQHVGKIVLNV